MKSLLLILLWGIILQSCTADQSVSDKDNFVGEPSALAESAAETYRSGVLKTHDLIQQGTVKAADLDKIFDDLKQGMTNYGQKAENFKPDDKGIYQHKFQIDAYEGLDSIAYVITNFKDSLKVIDPNDTRIVQLEGIMSLSVYADFDQLKRVYPSKHAALIKSQN